MRLPRKALWSFCMIVVLTISWVVDFRFFARLLFPVGELPRSEGSCLALLHSGKLINGSVWQPNGCSLHWYTEQKAASCFRARVAKGLTNHFAFIGDSRMRYMSFDFMVRFGFERPDENPKLRGMGDYSVECPHMEVPATAARYVADMLLITHQAKPTKQHEPPPTLIVGGAAIWYMVDDFYAPKVRLANMTLDQRLQLYKAKIAAWAQDATAFIAENPKSKVVWILQEPLGLQKPLLYNLTNYKMDLFNTVAEDALKPFKNVLVWKSARMFNIAYNQSGHAVLNADPIHTKWEVIDYQIQMLMNLVCNEYIAESLANSACCSRNEEDVINVAARNST